MKLVIVWRGGGGEKEDGGTKLEGDEKRSGMVGGAEGGEEKDAEGG